MADFSLVAAAPSLVDFTLDCYLDLVELSEQQVAQCRSSLAHLQRIDLGQLNSKRLAMLLQPPVTARWQAIGTVRVDRSTGDTLLTLPTLTTLDLWLLASVLHADFLSKLPLLTTLHVRNGKVVAAESMLRSLLPCTGITELDLDCVFSSAQVSTLLATFTKLRKLTLRGALHSLQCFSSGPVTQTLEELNLSMRDTMPLSELPHLFALKCLRSLRLWRCFTSPLDAATIAGFSPPCSSLPLLTQLDACWPNSPSQWTIVKRKGPSFEWMQKRLLQ